MARGDSNNFSSVSYSFASFLFVANETLTPPALHPAEARSQHATSLVCTTLQRGLLSSRLLRALDSIGSPGCLHPFTLVVLTSNRIERVHLDDELTKNFCLIDDLLFLSGGLAFSTAASSKVAVGLAGQRDSTGNLVYAVFLVLGHEDVLRQKRTHLRGVGDRLRHGTAHLVRRLRILASARERKGAHHRAHEGDGEVGRDAKNGLLNLETVVSHSHVKHFVQSLHMLVLLVVPEARVTHVEVAQNISITT
mmetsp:Transcript_1765/g.2403  ORF Transcript_1765/g.2403 Transcript_1765/m.2403 type:complete len:251 (+) Transcript_1765:1071-1823(+)